MENQKLRYKHRHLQPNSNFTVDIRRLKTYAFNELPKNWVLRDILLDERDELDFVEFISKVEIWLKLAQGKVQ